jgi:hypothetical protein
MMMIFSVLFVAVAAATALSGPTTIHVPGGVIEATVEAAPRNLTRAQLLEWVEKRANGVAAYYGGFPVDRMDLTLESGGWGKVGGGRTLGGRRGARIKLSIGSGTTAEDLAEDWQITHEMIHLAFPSMPGRHSWVEEGLATYVEPIVRARADRSMVDNIWQWLTWGLPQGAEAAARDGLDNSGGRGATYWGGALFCFLADVEIRRRTGNQKSLDDALRGIVHAGGNVNVSWPLASALSEGDKAVGVPVLSELYAKMGSKAYSVDVRSLLSRLGVSGGRSHVTYDDGAPLAAIRKGISTGGR